MRTDATLAELRAGFGRGRMLAMPIAGTIAWTAAGILGAILTDEDDASIALFIVFIYLISIVVLMRRQRP